MSGFGEGSDMAATAVAAHGSGQGHDTGIWSWITTVDHKRIGVMYFVASLVFLVIGGIEALIIRIQLWAPDGDFVTAETYNQLFTMHGTTMIFLVAMPLSVAFFNYVVPLQIGARDVAFPRLNALSFWIFLFGGIFLNSSWLFGMAPNTSWVGYANLTSRQFSPGNNVDFWVLGLSILGVSSIMGGVNFITTIVNLRAPGMKLMRMPLLTWMTLVTSFIIVTALPVIAVALILLLFDRFFGANFYVPTAGGDPVLWQHLFWLFGHPEVYLLILPSFGIISDVIPTFSRKPLFGYPVVVYAGILIGFIGWGVWSHHMFTTGLGPIADAFFVASTMIIAIPTGVKIFNWLATMWGGQIRFTTPMLYCVGLIAIFTLGGPERHHARVGSRRPTAARYVLRGGALPLRGGGGRASGHVRGDPLLVPQGHGQDDERAAREAELLDLLHRVQPHVLPNAHERHVRDAKAYLDVRRRDQHPVVQSALHHRRVRVRVQRSGHGLEHRLERPQGREGGAEPVGGLDAGVGDSLAAAPLQLPGAPDHPESSAALA